MMEGKRLKIHRSAVAEIQNESAKCGEVISVSPLVVKCGGNTAIELLEIQAEGKKRMLSEDYLRGHKTEIGIFLE